MVVGSTNTNRFLDFYDRRILEILDANSRTPFSQVARELNASEGMIRARVRRLMEDGIIRRFTIETDS